MLNEVPPSDKHNHYHYHGLSCLMFVFIEQKNILWATSLSFGNPLTSIYDSIYETLFLTKLRWGYTHDKSALRTPQKNLSTTTHMHTLTLRVQTPWCPDLFSVCSCSTSQYTWLPVGPQGQRVSNCLPWTVRGQPGGFPCALSGSYPELLFSEYQGKLGPG